MSTPAAPPQGRVRQIVQAYKITKRTDKTIGLRLLCWFVVVAVVVGAVLWFVIGRASVLGLVLTVVLTFLSALLATVIVFGRRAESAAYSQVEGQVGAAAGALNMLKRGWTVKSAVGFTKSQDVVHRVVGPPGIVLVGEGNPARVRALLNVEKKKHTRIAGDVPITDIIVGEGAGQVPLPKLVKTVQKLPKGLPPGQMTPLLSKLKALDSRPQVPLPKGPLPTNARGARKSMKGR